MMMVMISHHADWSSLSGRTAFKCLEDGLFPLICFCHRVDGDVSDVCSFLKKTNADVKSFTQNKKQTKRKIGL